MKIAYEITTTVEVSELRRGTEKVLDGAQKGPIMIGKRRRPMGVLMSCREYSHIQYALETAEEVMLGFVAHSRFRRSSARDYIDIEDLVR